MRIWLTLWLESGWLIVSNRRDAAVTGLPDSMRYATILLCESVSVYETYSSSPARETSKLVRPDSPSVLTRSEMSSTCGP